MTSVRRGSGGLRRVAAAAIALALIAAPAAAQAPPADAPATNAKPQAAKPPPGAAKPPPAAAKPPPAAAKPPPAAPGAVAGPPAPPKINAKAWALIDPRDDAVLASKAANKPLAIASATKLMTAYLALKKLKPTQRLTAPAYKALPAESLIGLRAGEKMTVRDLLYGLVLESGNDAAVTLAEGVAGSVPEFVAQMNRRAAALGLENTSYANPIGLDAPDNYSSAADLVTLADALLENKLFARIADSQAAVLRSGDSPRRIDSRNTLLGRDATVDGVKTGHTIQAGYVLVGSATRDGTRLVSAVLGAGSEAARDAETLKLLDYGFSLYEPSRPVSVGDELADPELDYRDERLPLIAERAVEVSARQGQPVEREVEAPDEISGAVEEGEELGRVVVTVDGDEAAVVPLVASRSVGAATLFDKAAASAQNPLILLPLGGIVILVGVLLALRGRDPQEEPSTRREPRRPRERRPEQRTPEERRKMHEERMRRRQQRNGGAGGDR